MTKRLTASLLLVLSFAFAQDSTPRNLPDIIATSSSPDFLSTGIDAPVIKKIIGNPMKLGTTLVNIKDAGGFESNYKVTKTDTFVQIFESSMVYWMTFNAHVTFNDIYISMVTSAQKDSNGRGNDLTFYSLQKKQQVELGNWYEDAVKFANGKCKVPKENIHFELKDNSDTIKVSGFDIFLSGKKYTLSAEINLVIGKGSKDDTFVFNSKTAKC
jgi:hypothetical protein